MNKALKVAITPKNKLISEIQIYNILICNDDDDLQYQ